MSQIILQDLDPVLLQTLRTRASKHGRSLEAELTAILQATADAELSDRADQMARFRERAVRMRQSLAGQLHSDSIQLIREDRDR